MYCRNSVRFSAYSAERKAIEIKRHERTMLILWKELQDGYY